ncbi:phytanoyl-CoA dioxygenase family protein [Actinomadura sp. 6N118]|uniref:phytanoyl-CoA dioxygenase family protein n=1 Tax=Actinomadura sp. 6N118 TaxID=3375151 RepID=UPI0037A49514
MTLTAVPAGLIADVRANGFAVWPTFVGPDRCVELAELAAELSAGPYGLRFPKSTRVWDLYRHGAMFVELLADTRLVAAVTELLGKHYLLSDFSLNSVLPGLPVDAWHLDYPFNEMPGTLSGSILGLQCVLALDPFTLTNGATELIAGTHDRPRTPIAAEIGERFTFVAEPGTLLVMAAATWHRSGLNASTAPRTAILLSFVERWVRPMCDPPEPGPWSHTEELRILLGMSRPPETINGVPI